MSTPEIYFYVQPDKYSDAWPRSLSDNRVAFGGGANVWSYFTAGALNELGFKVNVTTHMPDEGIVLCIRSIYPSAGLPMNEPC